MSSAQKLDLRLLMRAVTTAEWRGLTDHERALLMELCTVVKTTIAAQLAEIAALKAAAIAASRNGMTTSNTGETQS